MLPRSRWQKTLSWSMLMASIIAVPISTRWGIIDPAGGGEWEAITRCSGELLFLGGAILGDALPSCKQITAGVQTRTEAES